MFDVTCIGILVADVIARTVNSLPECGKLNLVDRIDLHSGGCASNAAISMAKVGLKTAIIGRIGNDGFGRFLSGCLKEYKVDTTGLVIDNEVGTSSSVVTVNDLGERTFLHYTGANAVFSGKDINYDIIRNSKAVFVVGTMLMPEFDGLGCAEFLKKAREMGKITALDTAWDSQGRWMNVLRPCMPYIDLFMPSFEEAVQLGGKDRVEDLADVFLSMGVKTAVIKLGEKGCFIKDHSGYTQRIPAYKNIKAVDTTGAGDSFCAGFLTGIIKDWSLEKCGSFANATGAHCVMEVGATTGIKTFEEIYEFMNRDR